MQINFKIFLYIAVISINGLAVTGCNDIEFFAGGKSDKGAKTKESLRTSANSTAPAKLADRKFQENILQEIKSQSAFAQELLQTPTKQLFDVSRLSESIPSNVEILGVEFSKLEQWTSIIEESAREIQARHDTYGSYLASREIYTPADIAFDQFQDNLQRIADLIALGPDAIRAKIAAEIASGKGNEGTTQGLSLEDRTLQCLKDVGQTALAAVGGTFGCINPAFGALAQAGAVATTAQVGSDVVTGKGEVAGQSVPGIAAAVPHAAEAIPCVGGWVSMADHGAQAAKDCPKVEPLCKHCTQRDADIMSDYFSQALR